MQNNAWCDVLIFIPEVAENERRSQYRHRPVPGVTHKVGDHENNASDNVCPAYLHPEPFTIEPFVQAALQQPPKNDFL